MNLLIRITGSLSMASIFSASLAGLVAPILKKVLLPVFLFSQNDLETAKQLIEKKDYEAAAQILESLVESDANNWELHHWLGLAYVENSKLPGTGMFKAMKL